MLMGMGNRKFQSLRCNIKNSKEIEKIKKIVEVHWKKIKIVMVV